MSFTAWMAVGGALLLTMAMSSALIQRLPVDLVAGDLTDPAGLTRVLPPAVDAVFHVAADTSVWARNDHRQTRINVDGTRHVVEAALARGARRFVHTSTWNVYGLEQGAISERSPQLGDPVRAGPTQGSLVIVGGGANSFAFDERLKTY